MKLISLVRHQKPLILLAILILLGLVACDSQSTLSTENNKRPSIIYILADDLGYGDIGVYGQQKILTPNLDKLARQGLSFTQHYAGSSVCGPSRASLLTGLHGGHSPIRRNPDWTMDGKAVSLKSEDVTVAEMLKTAGYHTAAIGKWGLSEDTTLPDDVIDPAMPNQQGFDYFFGLKFHTDAHYHYQNKLWKNNHPYYLSGNDPLTNKGQYINDLFTQEALSFVDSASSDEPFFLYLAYTIPHLPLAVPDDSRTAYENLDWPKRPMNMDGHFKSDPDGNVSFAGMVTRMDQGIGQIMDLLEQKGMLEDTLVIFTSDNGPLKGNDWFDSNGKLRGGKRALYEGGIRVPFIASWPGTIAEDETTDHLSAFWDMMPTLCDLSQAKRCPQTDGISLVPTLIGQPEQQRQHDYLYWEFNGKAGPIQAVRFESWKLVRFYGKSPQLYALDKDISETTNVAEQHLDMVSKLTQIMDAARTYEPEFALKPINQSQRRIGAGL